jgi:hypothetical protein
MALRRHYSITLNGIMRVRDTQTGDLSQHYGNLPAAPAWGRTAADLFVDDNGTHVLMPNGAGRGPVQGCIDLLTEYNNDLGRQHPDPRAF